MVIFVVLVVLLGLYMAWNIGANDFANSMADAVGSGALSLRGAVILGGLCEFAGSVLVGMFVADTVRMRIVAPEHFAAAGGLLPKEAAAMFAMGMACALLAAAAWLHLATWFGMPVSTTHSIVGAVAGFGMVAVGIRGGFVAGIRVVEWHMMGGIVASWFLSPVVGLLGAYLVFKAFSWLILNRANPVVAAIRYAPAVVFSVVLIVMLSIFYKGGIQRIVCQREAVRLWFTGWRMTAAVVGKCLASALAAKVLIGRYLRGVDALSVAEQLAYVEKVFAPLVILTSCSVAFAHGANDVANAIGPLAAVVDIVKTGTLSLGAVVPLWTLALGGVGIVIGLATYGYRVLRTIGTKITQLTPSRGVAADFATILVVLVCSRMGLPISTTHTIVGAILGVGLARGLGAVNRKVTRDIFGSWLITVPVSAFMSALFFVIFHFCGVDGLILRLFPQ